MTPSSSGKALPISGTSSLTAMYSRGLRHNPFFHRYHLFLRLYPYMRCPRWWYNKRSELRRYNVTFWLTSFDLLYLCFAENAQSASMHRCNFTILDVGTVLRSWQGCFWIDLLFIGIRISKKWRSKNHRKNRSKHFRWSLIVSIIQTSKLYMDLYFQNDVPDSWNHDKS